LGMLGERPSAVWRASSEPSVRDAFASWGPVGSQVLSNGYHSKEKKDS